MAKERRAFARLKPSMCIDIRESGVEVGQTGRVANYSMQGMLIVSASLWCEQQRYNIVLLPNIKASEAVNGAAGCNLLPLKVCVECLWIESHESMSWVGVQFVDKHPVTIVETAAWIGALQRFEQAL